MRSTGSPSPSLASARRSALIERGHAQCDFVAALAGHEGEPSQRWTELAGRARAVVDAAAGASLTGLAEAVAEAEGILAPAATAAKSHTIHCVGHAHIDMNWLWGWPETVATTLDTFRTMLALFDEFPDFIFAQSQASVYRIVEEYEPELLERIRARVREGRWEVVASHWVEGDRNCAGGEALCRHLLLTRSYLRRLFDLAPEDVPVDWSPDTFGHAATMPAIDLGGGARYLYACRTGDPSRPPVFWWRSPDGSRQLVHRETTWYHNAVEPAFALRALDFRRATGLKTWLLVYGVGDHGGGPTRRDLRRLAEMDAWPVFPRWRGGRVADYFRMLERDGARWPELSEELNFEFAGCYSAQSVIKRGNRAGELLCAAADAAAALAYRSVGHQPRRETLVAAWRDVLFGQFHDILPGSGAAATRHWQQGLQQRIQAGAGQVRQQALRAVAARIDTGFAADPAEDAPAAAASRGGGGAGRLLGDLSAASPVTAGARPYVVHNPCGWDRREVVVLTVWDGDGPDRRPPHERDWVVAWPDGTSLVPQRVGHGRYWGHDYVDLAVPVTVAAGGWGVLAVREQPSPPASPSLQAFPSAHVDLDEDGGHGLRSNNPAGGLRLRNDRIIAVVDRRSGGISELRIDGVLVSGDGGFAVPEIERERPIAMSAWVLGDVDGPAERWQVDGIEPGERGPWRATVIVRMRHGDSRLTVTYGLRATADRLDITMDLSWRERGGSDRGTPRLRLRCASRGATAARYEIPFGSITRPSGGGREVPALRWAAVEADGSGFALLNDGQHGHSLDADGVLRLTILRASYDPDPLPEIGDHRIRLAVSPWKGERSTASIGRAAGEHEQPLVIIPTDAHAGPLPAVAAGLRLEDEDATIAGVKPAEDGDGLIVRVVEQAGRERAVTLRVPPGVFGVVAAAEACDLLERPVQAPPLAPVQDQIAIHLTPHAIATVRLRFADGAVSHPGTRSAGSSAPPAGGPVRPMG